DERYPEGLKIFWGIDEKRINPPVSERFLFGASYCYDLASSEPGRPITGSYRFHIRESRGPTLQLMNELTQFSGIIGIKLGDEEIVCLKPRVYLHGLSKAVEDQPCDDQ